MNKLIGFTVALVFAVGCSKGGDVGALSKLKDEACACKDKACGDAVNKKLDEAVEKMAKDMGGKEPEGETAKKLMEVMTEAGVCLAKLQ
jgi:hypothetical protein